MKKVASLMFIFAFLLAGCVFTQKPVTTADKVYTYEEVGEMLFDTYTILVALEAGGRLQGANLQTAKNIYNQARTIYIQAGDLLKTYIGESDAAKRKDAKFNYHQLLRQAAVLIAKLP